MRTSEHGRPWKLVVFAALLTLWGCSSSTTDSGHTGNADTGQPGIQDAGGGGDTTQGQKPDGSVADVQDVSGGDEDTDAPLPGQLGAPCMGNDECDSGFCVPGPAGNICTQTCVAECPQDWACRVVVNLFPDTVSICVPTGMPLCEPCQDDVQCGEARCVDLRGAGFCLPPCATDADCAGGFSCQLTGTGESVCAPVTGSCTCRQEADADKRESCTVANDFGECGGIAVCDPAQGWIDCSAPAPAPEICDGQDNDCDGLLDDDLPATRECEVTNEFGTCVGSERCFGVRGWVCDAPTPSAEVCDYLDNDCDGLTDEAFRDEFGAYAADNHCGACNASCTGVLPNATSGCDPSEDPPRCVVLECAPGYTKLNKYQCIPDGAGLCEPCESDAVCLIEGARCLELEDGSFCGKPCDTDNDCPDGYGCGNFGGEGQCAPLSNSCTCTSFTTGLQRDCSATWTDPTDPDSPVFTCYGVETCQAGGWSACDLPEEICDSIDNDCDGLIDEGFRDLESGTYLEDEHCGQCGNNCTFQTFSHGSARCQLDDGVARCTLVCNPGWENVDENPANGCECQNVGGVDVPDGIDQNCDGVDGDIDNAVFVAKDGDDILGAGTPGSPVRSLETAIQLARQLGLRDVYVATGLYEESVLLRTGVHVYGGYSADFRVRDPRVYETTLFGGEPTAERPGTVNATDLGSGATTLDGFTVFGVSRFEPGASSVAVYLRDVSSAVTITNNRIVAGSGGDGDRGDSGPDGQGGADGVSGRPAFDVGSGGCGGPSAGGDGGWQTCGGLTVSGGDGGDAQCPDYDEDPGEIWSTPFPQTQAPGENGADGANGGGEGGHAGYDNLLYQTATACNVCQVPKEASGEPFLESNGSDGGDGSDGADGMAGVGCTDSDGVVAGGIWLGATARDGGSGADGSGGGGGGAGGGVETVDCEYVWLYDDVGGSGGGGGSGGCHANGGKAGGSGGGSFGILLVYTGFTSTVPDISGNTIETGRGGDGGDGGFGGRGGEGGVGAAGGPQDATASAYWCASSGGYGGNGGRGGHGGGGGGGCGGVSYGLFVDGAGGASLTGLRQNTYDLRGAGGSGGAGGASLGISGSSGAGGAAGDMNF